MLQVLAIIIVIGVLLWLAIRFIPMEATFQRILIAVAVILVVLYLFNVFGVFALINQPVPRLR